MRKLAITISGAVSLGSYEAGVLFEVFAALKSHNLACDAAGATEEKVFVDVITGASAGGMSATILSQKLMYASGDLDGADTNALYMPWVKEITLEALLKDNADTTAGKSILNSGEVAAIARKSLLSRYSSGTLTADKHPAADSTIHLGLAMTNMNGIDYGVPTSGGQFLYTKFADQVSFDVQGLGSDNQEFWLPVMQAALACGAFPFAFKDREVPRKTSDYPTAFPTTPPLQNPLEFTYVDGGVFQNEPLGLAKNIVDKLPNSATDVRTYLYVAPSLRDSDAKYDFSADGVNFFFNVERLLTVIFNQARFQDWIQTVKVNKKILQSNGPAEDVKNELLSDPSKLTLLTKPFPRQVKGGLGTAPATPLARARKRGLEQSFRELENHSQIGTAGAEAWLEAVEPVSSPSAAPYDFMPIDSIISDPTKLASGGLYAFAGFFDEQLRQHDYDLGRRNASDAILNGLKNLGHLRDYKQPTIPELNTDLEQRKPSQLNRSLRVRFRDRLRDGVKELLKETGEVNWFGRWAADLFVVKPALNKILDL